MEISGIAGKFFVYFYLDAGEIPFHADGGKGPRAGWRGGLFTRKFSGGSRPADGRRGGVTAGCVMVVCGISPSAGWTTAGNIKAVPSLKLNTA